MSPDDFDAMMAAEGVAPAAWRKESHRRAPAAPKPAPTAPGEAAAPPSDPARDRLAEDLRAARAERDRLAEDLRAVRAERDALSGDLDAVRSERDRYDRERRKLSRRLDARPAAPTPTPVAAALARRGLEPSEHADALADLLLQLPGDTLAGLLGADTLPDLLDDRIVLTCGQERCAPRNLHGIAVTVSPARCELCAGSDRVAMWRRFVSSCERAGVSRIILVGGSPPYRRALRELMRHHGAPRHLELVDGRQNPNARNVRSARHADLVVAWGGTILDHATTDAYRATGAPVLTIPHRGLMGMLERLVAHLEG